MEVSSGGGQRFIKVKEQKAQTQHQILYWFVSLAHFLVHVISSTLFISDFPPVK